MSKYVDPCMTLLFVTFCCRGFFSFFFGSLLLFQVNVPPIRP